VSLLAAAAQRRPLLLVMDDLQNADSSSWLLLAHVAPRLRSLPVVVLATWRTDLQPPEPPAAALLRQVRVVPVPPLGLDQLGSLIDGVAGRAVDPGVAAAVHRRTSGNPLLAQEVVGALDARDGLDDAGAVATVVPESMRNLVGERLTALPPATRQALAAGAALGTTFPLGVLANALGQDGLGLLDALNPALVAGLLTALEPAEAAFAHDVVRDVVLGLETAAGRARLHRQIGDALERLRGSGQNVDPVDLARHFLAAGPGSAAEGVRYAREAGRRAMAMLAYEDAAAWFGQAAALARHQAPGVGAAERTELLLALGDAQEASGTRSTARRSYLDAADEARAAARPDLLAGAALGLSGTVGFEVSLLDRAQIDLLREAVDALGPDDLSLRASVTARLAVAVSFLDDVTARARMAEEAVALARGAGDEVALVQALAALCDAIAGPEHVAARTGLAAEIVDVGTRLRDPRIELLGRRLSVVALLEQGDVDGADREIQAFAAAAATMRRPFYSWYVPLWRATRAGMDGRLAEAWAALAEAEAVVAASDTENGPMLTTTLRWHLLSELDHTEEIAALLAGSRLDELPGLWPLVSRSLCAAQLGQPDASRALLDTAAARLPDAERDSEWLPMVAQVAETVGLLGSHPVAAWAYDALLPYQSHFAVEGIGAGVRGPVERSLGTLAASLGRREDALAHFDAALAAAGRVGAGLVVARTLRDAGVSLGDRDRLAEARRRYQALGADRRVAEIDRLLGGDAEEAPPPVAGNVFRREGEVWRVVHAGREVRLRDSKGLRDLARMLGEPARPFPAVELAGAPAGPGGDAGAEGLHAQGDLGELVDAQAREAYRRRLADLDEEIDDADRAADVERSAKAAAEKEALVAHLAAAYGLGGRPRRTGDPAERARQTVTARIREAMTRIDSAHPDLGRHLRRSVRTGRICVYEPDSPIEWST